MNYTKGEWIFDAEHMFIKTHTKVIGIMQYQSTSNEVEANAHLIAAAPMLYEACQSALALLKDQYNIVLGQYPKYGKFPGIILLEKALAKANGE